MPADILLGNAVHSIFFVVLPDVVLQGGIYSMHLGKSLLLFRQNRSTPVKSADNGQLPIRRGLRLRHRASYARQIFHLLHQFFIATSLIISAFTPDSFSAYSGVNSL